MGSRRRFIASVSSSEDDAESGLDVGGVTVRAPLLFHRGSAGGGSGDRISSSSDTAAVAFTCQDALDQIGFGRWHVVLLCFSGMVWFSDAVAIMLLSHIGPAVSAWCGPACMGLCALWMTVNGGHGKEHVWKNHERSRSR